MPSKKSDSDEVLEALGRFSDLVFARFDQVDVRFDKIQSKLAEHDEKFDKIFNILDSHLKKIEDILQENSMRDRQQARMEEWIFQIADKVGVKLKYDS